MCIKAVEVDPWQLDDVPNHLKTQRMCDKTVEEEPSCLQFVPDSFVTQGQVKLWHDYDDYYDDNKLIEWYDVIKNIRPKKQKLKKS